MEINLRSIIPLCLIFIASLCFVAEADYKLGNPLQKQKSRPTSSDDGYYRPGAAYYKQLAVEGFVFCKGSQRKPLQGATVGAVSYASNRYVEAKTNSYGYFYIPLNYNRQNKPVSPKSWRVFLVSSPDQTCNIKTNTGDGKTGAVLVHSKSLPDRVLYTVGPFEFAPYIPPKY